MADTDVQEILHAVRDVDFPADKDELIAEARTAGASGEVVKALRGIPPEEYANRDEVARSVAVPPDTDLGHSPAQRAEQHRKGGRPGQSELLRDADRPPVEDELER